MKREDLNRLAQALTATMPEETILVTASRTEGRRLLTALAARGHLLLGVRTETPFTLAQELCGAELARSDAPCLMNETERAARVRSAMQEGAEIFTRESTGSLQAVRMIAQTLQELDLAEVSTVGGTAKRNELQALRDQYKEEKQAKRLWDRADTLSAAIRIAAKGEDPLCRANYVLLGDYVPAPLEQTLLDMLSGAGVRLNKVRFSSHIPAEQLQRELIAGLRPKGTRFVACRGEETEARFPLRDMLERGLPAEQCAVVYLSERYALMLYEEAARFSVPVSMGGGLPLSGSMVYTTLKKISELPQRDYYAEEVSVLLENGNCAPKQRMKLAENLRQRKVGWGRGRYERGWGYYKAEDSFAPTDEEQEDWKKFLALLIAVAAQEGSVEQQRNTLLDFLPYCFLHYPVRQGEAAAHAKTEELAAGIVEIEPGETVLQRLLTLMEQTSYLSGDAESGKLYCAAPTQAAGLERKYLYVLGFGRLAMQGNQKESPVLLDEERQELTGMKTSWEKGAEREYQVLQILAQHEGELVLTYPDYDSSGMLEQGPDSFFKDAAGVAAVSGKERINEEKVTYIPTGTAQLAADELLTQTAVKLERARVNPVSGKSLSLLAEPSRADQLKSICYSASALEEALKCPYAFYMKRVLKLRASQQVERNDDMWLNAAEKGTFCHDVLEKYYRLAQPTLNDLKMLFDKELERLEEIPLPRETLREPTRQELWAMLERAVDWTNREKRTPVETEEEFTQDMTFGNWTLKVTGKIDRVDRLTDGSYAILDYKTGNPDNIKSEIHCHWQHYLYTVAEEQLHPERGSIGRAGYLFLRGDEPEMVELTEDRFLRAETAAHIEWLMNRISQADYEPECMPCFRLEADDPNNPRPAGQPRTLLPGTEEERSKGLKNCGRWCEFAEICPKQIQLKQEEREKKSKKRM